MLPNRDGRLDAPHLRHLDVHQDEVEGLAPDRVDRLAAVLRQRDVMAALLQQPDGDSLIDDVVFGQQDPCAA